MRSRARRDDADGDRLLAELSERCARACQLLRVPLEGPLVVACSGGADSAAVLMLMRRVAPRAKITACYIDHGIRPAASIARDVAAVRAQARAARASTRVDRVSLAPKTNGSPEERARVARYRALASVARACAASMVITGHQQDDLSETSLLALIRGSGIDGLAAMRPMRSLAPGVTLARPLLWATKAQCRALVGELHIPISEDETNADPRILRNAVRAFAATLERELPGASRGIARSAGLLVDDKALLDRLSAIAWRRSRLADTHELSAAALRKMPVALIRRVIRHAIAVSGSSLRNFSFEHCNAIATTINEKRGGRFHAGAATVVLSAGKVIVQSENLSSTNGFVPVAIDVENLPRDVVTAGGRLTLRIARSARRVARTNTTIQHLDLDSLRAAGRLEIRLPRPGDSCIPSGRSRPMSLARFLGKSGVPTSGRATASLLCAGGRIAAVLGLRVMEPFRPKDRTRVLEVGWRAADT